MLSLEKPEYSIQFIEQTYKDLEGNICLGEQIRHPQGHTGYVEWSEDSDHKTARMLIVGEYIDIRVNENARNQGIGTLLFETLIQRLKEKGFSHLKILGATQRAKIFYDNRLDNLRESSKILNYCVESRLDRNYTDYLYTIEL